MIAQYHFILWMVVGVFAAACLVVLGLLARSTLGRNARARPAPGDARQTLRDRVWTFAPACVFALVAALLMRSVYLQNTTPAPDLTITVTGHMWYWTYAYSNVGNFSFSGPMLAKSPGQNAANLAPRGAYDHIIVPVDKTVRIVAVATDVIYSWAIPAIGAEIEAVPGWTRPTSFRAAKEGRYYGQCSELCGL